MSKVKWRRILSEKDNEWRPWVKTSVCGSIHWMLFTLAKNLPVASKLENQSVIKHNAFSLFSSSSWQFNATSFGSSRDLLLYQRRQLYRPSNFHDLVTVLFCDISSSQRCRFAGMLCIRKKFVEEAEYRKFVNFDPQKCGAKIQLLDRLRAKQWPIWHQLHRILFTWLICYVKMTVYWAN